MDIYKIITFYSLDSGLPVSFELQPGNIPDVISLVNAVPRAKAYGLKNPEFCLDNGFFSKENVLRFLRKNFKFTILATLCLLYTSSHAARKLGCGSCCTFARRTRDMGRATQRSCVIMVILHTGGALASTGTRTLHGACLLYTSVLPVSS